MTEALAAPFRIVFGRPVTTVVWGLVLLLPVVLAASTLIPLFVEMAQTGVFDPEALEAASNPAANDATFAAMMQVQMLNMGVNIVQWLAALVVTTAAIRAVFAGKRGDRFAFLRVSMDEFHVALIGLAVLAGAIVIGFVLILLTVGIGFGLAQVGEWWAGLIAVFVCVAAFVGFFLLWGRAALLAPAAVHYRSFGFEEGWALGRGQSWKLLGMMVLLFLLALMLMMLMMLVIVIVLAVGAGGLASRLDAASLEVWSARLASHSGVLIGAAVVLLIPFAWLQGFFQILFTAPFASVVKDLTWKPAPISTDAPGDAG